MLRSQWFPGHAGYAKVPDIEFLLVHQFKHCLLLNLAGLVVINEARIFHDGTEEGIHGDDET